jgi:holliday junction DNA helicase RuvA
MIGMLQGTIRDIQDHRILLEVQGVGYEVFIPFSAHAPIPTINSTTLFHTHLHFRENILELYGFSTKSERDLFRFLLGISRLGPKIALKCIETYSVREFYQIASQQDLKAIEAIPGLGKKTAEAVLLETKNKLKHLEGIVASDTSPIPKGKAPDLSKRNEAVDALIGLDFSEREALDLVNRILKENPDATLEEILRKGLQLSAP